MIYIYIIHTTQFYLIVFESRKPTHYLYSSILENNFVQKILVVLGCRSSGNAGIVSPKQWLVGGSAV